MNAGFRSAWGGLVMVAVCATLVGCAGTQTGNRAPIEDRSAGGGFYPTPAPAVDPRTLPGYENMGKTGYYTVQRGDTVRKIAQAHNQDWRNLVAWNANVLPNPDAIEVGQVLRVTPAGGTTQHAPVPQPVPTPTPTPAPTPTASQPASSTPSADRVNFIWPASGTVVKSYDGINSKGVAIAGRAGDPVVAAADGKVVYAGAGLRGYGQLIILKHNNTYLTAYAHNRALLVKEDQTVSKGQRIAEMGSTDADRVQLHFEVRRQGSPVNPMNYLPAR